MSEVFSGGEKFKEKMDAIIEAIAPGSSQMVRVGFLKGSTCGSDNSQDAPTIAFFNEYGTIGRQDLESFTETSRVTDTVTKVRRKGKMRASVKTKAGLAGPWHIPPRPFFRTMIEKNKARWGKLLAACLKNQNYNARKALAEVGLKIHEQLQQSIEEFTTPGNAPSTIRAKGFDAPLQNSKNMKRAVSFEVIDGGAE